VSEPIFLTTEKGFKIRILTPYDYDTYVVHIDKDYLRTVFNIAFWSGMRYVEVQRLHRHPEWWLRERRTIYLPREAQKKVKRVAPERYIPVPPQIQNELPYFFKNRKPPSLKVWNDNLKRWARKAGFDTLGITAKMTRASIESWMYAAGMLPSVICQRQGHDKLTSLNHYMAIPFTEAEKAEIKKRLAGWW
jgi:hypothetical protein